MPPDELSDDHVAEILKRDAKTSSIRYSTAGLQAFLPKRPVSQAPKPNTRFLKSIIRDTDNHNAAILAKEAKDSRLRLKALQGKRVESNEEDYGSWKSRGIGHEGYDRHHHHRHQRRSEHKDEYRHAKRRRVGRDGIEQDTASSHHKSSTSNHIDDKHRARDEARGRRRHSSRKERGHSSEPPDENHSQPRRTNRHHRHRRRRRSWSRDSRSSYDSSGIEGSKGVNHDKHRRRRKVERELHLSRSRSHLPDDDTRHSDRRQSPTRRRHHKRRHRSQSTSRSPRTTPHQSHTPSRLPSSDYNNDDDDKDNHSDDDQDSDPLAAIIGPLPPQKSTSQKHTRQPILRTKGRGKNTTITSSTAIDAHFAPDYDPTIDLQPDSDLEEQCRSRKGIGALVGDDWDQALEALRDRQRWRQQGADRLLAAGFSAEEVRKWQRGGLGGRDGFGGDGGNGGNGGNGGDEEDVRWAKKGEGREWDRGKVVDEDGNVAVQAEWGRLKGM